MHTMKRCLIINADDLGYTSGINSAVDRCAASGSLRSATLMANGEAFEDAVAMAKANKGLSVGVHLVLTGLEPLSRSKDIPGLVGDDGRLPPDLGTLLIGLMSGKISKRAIQNELELQVGRVLDHGIHPTHLDGHKHVHILPGVLESVAEVASRHSIRWIRNPFEHGTCQDFFPLIPNASKGTFIKQHMKAYVTRVLRLMFLRILRRTGCCAAPRQLLRRLAHGTLWNEALVRRLVAVLPPGLSEWMLHPGVCDEDLLRLGSRLRESREVERDILLSPLLREWLEEHRVTLVAYGEEHA